jgi:hypothetical protein
MGHRRCGPDDDLARHIVTELDSRHGIEAADPIGPVHPPTST